MTHIIDHNKTNLKQQSTPPPTTTSSLSPPPLTTASPPSPASSPTHDFSFIQHYNPNIHNTSNTYKTNTNSTNITTTTLQPPPPPVVIDLSPADDIFFKGQLLPLNPHFNLHDSPRSSTNSMDSFTLPLNLLYNHSNPIGNTSFHCHHQTTFSDSEKPATIDTNPVPNRSKSKPFSIFGIPKWKKGPDDEIETDLDHTKERNSKKLKLDHLGQLIKRYMKMVRPLLLFPKSKRSNASHQSYSFSTNSLSRKPPEMSRGGKRRGQFSAPASMRASPGNSGILVASGFVSPTKGTSESSMEELHAAIQAAIAHCKNSIAMEEKNQSQK